MLMVALTLLVLELSAPCRAFRYLGDDTVRASYVPVTRFDPSRDAASDIRDAAHEARRSGRRVLLDVGGDWCVWCLRLDRFFEENSDIRDDLHRRFVVVKVNFSRENRNEKVLSAYPRIPGYPHLFVLDAGGGFLHSQDTAELEEGKGYSREKVKDFIWEWGGK